MGSHGEVLALGTSGPSHPPTDRLFTGSSQRMLYTRNLQEDLKMARYAAALERARRATQHDFNMQQRVLLQRHEQLTARRAAAAAVDDDPPEEEASNITLQSMGALTQEGVLDLMEKLEGVTDSRAEAVEERDEPRSTAGRRSRRSTFGTLETVGEEPSSQAASGPARRSSTGKLSTSSGGGGGGGIRRRRSEPDSIGEEQLRPISVDSNQCGSVYGDHKLSTLAGSARSRRTGVSSPGQSTPRQLGGQSGAGTVLREETAKDPLRNEIGSPPARAASWGAADRRRETPASSSRPITCPAGIGLPPVLQRKLSVESMISSTKALSRRSSQSGGVRPGTPRLIRRASASVLAPPGYKAPRRRESLLGHTARSRSTGDAPDPAGLFSRRGSRQQLLQQQAVTTDDLVRLTRRLSMTSLRQSDSISDRDLMVDEERKIYDFLHRMQGDDDDNDDTGSRSTSAASETKREGGAVEQKAVTPPWTPRITTPDWRGPRRKSQHAPVVYTASAERRLSNLFGSDMVNIIDEQVAANAEAEMHRRQQARQPDELVQLMTMAPLSLPPVHVTSPRGVAFRHRNFDRQAEERKDMSKTAIDLGSLRFCRYLRVPVRSFEREEPPEAALSHRSSRRVLKYVPLGGDQSTDAVGESTSGERLEANVNHQRRSEDSELGLPPLTKDSRNEARD